MIYGLGSFACLYEIFLSSIRTEVPWEDVKAKKEKAKAEKELAASAKAVDSTIPKTEYNFSDRHASLCEFYSNFELVRKKDSDSLPSIYSW